MRHFFIVMTMVGCSLTCYAQSAKEMYETQNMKPNNYSVFSIGKGTKFISGGIGLSFGNVSTSSYYGTYSDYVYKPNPIDFSLSGGFGGFVSDKLVLAVGLGYAHNTTPTSQLGKGWLKQYFNLFGISVGIEGYGKITDNFFYTPGLSIGGLFGNGKEDIDYTDYVSFKAQGIALQGHLLAFEFRPTNRFAINMSVGYYIFEFVKLNEENDGLKVEIVSSDYKFGNTSMGITYYF